MGDAAVTPSFDWSHLFSAVLALADDHLILGHRVSQWCGHAPMLEEDLSMPNMALDMIGQARNLYAYAGTLEGAGRDEDALAYLRLDRDYTNLLLVERPNGDFAHTMLRQFYFAAFMEPFWGWMAQNSVDDTLRAIAAKAQKEASYHLRHSSEWVIRLGDGTDESAWRMRAAVEALHIYTDEMFAMNTGYQTCLANGVMPDLETVRATWQASVDSVFGQAFLTVPEVEFPQRGGRDGLHTEDFGHLLADLQYMQRAYPGLQW
ncbi:MAG: 1,2-phenylacetyl-CoA epoxidase subunit PaaC [Pseudomonadota bacterium]